MNRTNMCPLKPPIFNITNTFPSSPKYSLLFPPNMTLMIRRLLIRPGLPWLSSENHRLHAHSTFIQLVDCWKAVWECSSLSLIRESMWNPYEFSNVTSWRSASRINILPEIYLFQNEEQALFRLPFAWFFFRAHTHHLSVQANNLLCFRL